MSARGYPLSAVVGHDVARRALLCLLVEERLAGALLQAPSGAGKSFLIDALMALAGTEGRRLPAGASLDDLGGALDVAATLASGRAVRTSGLLERACGTWLVAEQVELLEPSVAAALARHVDDGGRLLATCAAVEDVSPTLAERLPLHLHLSGGDREESFERLRRLWCVDRDPGAFADQWRPAQDALFATVQRARMLLQKLPRAGPGLSRLDARAVAAGLPGARGALGAWRVARAHAVLSGLSAVTEEDEAFAERVVITPRSSRDPSAPAPEKKERSAPDPSETRPEEPTPQDGAERESEPDAKDPRSGPPPGVLAPEAAPAPDLTTLLSLRRATGPGGRRGRVPSWKRGRPTRTFVADGRRGRVAIVPTLRRAAFHRQYRPVSEGVLLTVRGEDLMIRRYERKLGTLFLFVVDASGSMARNNMRAAKGAVIALLREAYVHRDQVALMAARGREAELAVPPTSSVARARALLEGLPTGGGTPLADALVKAHGLALRKQRDERPVVIVIFTDGRANVALDGSGDADTVSKELAAVAERWRGDALETVLVDTRPLFDRRLDAARLAEQLGAHYHRLTSRDPR